ncbi:hypothetical protein BKA80DRAFT_256559 [Phyllosticta citrichinensis]
MPLWLLQLQLHAYAKFFIPKTGAAPLVFCCRIPWGEQTGAETASQTDGQVASFALFAAPPNKHPVISRLRAPKRPPAYLVAFLNVKALPASAAEHPHPVLGSPSPASRLPRLCLTLPFSDTTQPPRWAAGWHQRSAVSPRRQASLGDSPVPVPHRRGRGIYLGQTRRSWAQEKFRVFVKGDGGYEQLSSAQIPTDVQRTTFWAT